jgi:hypothetical protein
MVRGLYINIGCAKLIFGAGRAGISKQHGRAAIQAGSPSESNPDFFLRLDPAGGIAHHGVDIAVRLQSASNPGDLADVRCIR